ncbi:hypothetical protein KHA90_02240 [Flavobacterium psychroterrae]|uniref:TonB-dependent receptor plug domain-containing protein n=1 Tax=Flavobacterium psychroterrae TaxID=2133767 RepID=A0ABS5P6S6_9FLAO|nr:hypothetical protein [Flavobacterium psychroterrae]MBS7229831.1 hypothetical protein [Flavobacterium psychroterrae]
MDRLIHIVLIAFIVSFQQISFAQKNNTASELDEIDKKLNESIYISTNANSFLTGETLLYKIFCIEKSTNIASKYSKIAYLQLVDSNKKTVFVHKLFLENGTANSDYFIPTTLETGNYKLIGYTNWMLNKKAVEYFDLDIYIVNPYKEKSTNIISQKESNPSENITNENISFDLKSKTYSNRDLIHFKITTTSEEFKQGNYSVSVRKADGFLSQKKTNFNDLKTNRNSTTDINNTEFSLPELRGEIISGKISATSAEVKNKKIALSIVGKNNILKLTKTDAEGKFIFNLEKSNSGSNIVVQIIEDNKQDYSIEIDKTKNIDFSNLTFPSLQFNSEFKQNISERLISSQIENAYYSIKKDSILASTDTVPFYNKLSTEFKLDLFTRFPTMEETITEVVKGVVFAKNKNNYSIHVYDYDPNYESELPALIVVDGLIIEDLKELFAYSPKNIHKINVVKGIYYYGAKSFNGIVAFTTKNGDYETKLKGNFILRPELLKPQSKKEYFQPDYANNKNERIPDYRHQLLWLPKVDLNNPESDLKFYASDVSGKYEIILEGFSANGKAVFIKEIIDIKDSNLN